MRTRWPKRTIGSLFAPFLIAAVPAVFAGFAFSEPPDSAIKRLVIPQPDAEVSEDPADAPPMMSRDPAPGLDLDWPSRKQPQMPIDQPPGSMDLVVIADRPALQGHVVSLAGSDLEVSTAGEARRIPRDDVLAVNFRLGQRGETASRPPVVDRGADVVVTYAGNVLSTHVDAITETSVITDAGHVAREEVDLVVFDVHETEPRPAPIWPDLPPAAGGSVSTSGPPEPPPAFSEDEPGDGALCPDDTPLGGWLKWQARFDNGWCVTTETATAWFTLDEVVSRMRDGTPSLFKGSGLYMEASGGPCIDVPGDWGYCSGSGVDWTSAEVEGSAWYWPLTPSLTIGWNTEAISGPFRNGYQCIFDGVVSDHDWPFPAPAARHIAPPNHPGNCGRETPGTAVFGVAPAGPCYRDLCRLKIREACLEDPRDFYVFPFTGESGGNWIPHFSPFTTAWAVCCGCGRPGQRAAPMARDEPPQPDDDEDCLEMARANEAWTREELQRYHRHMMALYRAFSFHYEATRAHTSRFRKSMALCGAAEVFMKIAEFFVTKGGDVAAAAVDFKNFVLGLAEGDPTILLPGGEAAEGGYDVLAWALGTFKNIAEYSGGTIGSHESLSARVRSCRSRLSPFADALFDDAQQFVLHRHQTHELAESIYRRVAELHVLRDTLNEKMQIAHERCVECAQEHGRDPAACPSPVLEPGMRYPGSAR